MLKSHWYSNHWIHDGTEYRLWWLWKFDLILLWTEIKSYLLPPPGWTIMAWKPQTPHQSASTVPQPPPPLPALSSQTAEPAERRERAPWNLGEWHSTMNLVQSCTVVFGCLWWIYTVIYSTYTSYNYTRSHKWTYSPYRTAYHDPKFSAQKFWQYPSPIPLH